MAAYPTLSLNAGSILMNSIFFFYVNMVDILFLIEAKNGSHIVVSVLHCNWAIFPDHMHSLAYQKKAVEAPFLIFIPT